MQLASLIMQVRTCVKILSSRSYSTHKVKSFPVDIPIPWDNINISFMSLDRHTRFLPCTYIPYCYCTIHRTRGKYVGFCGTPLQGYTYISWDNHIQGNIWTGTWYIIQWHAWRSSTLAECPTNGFASTFQLVGVGSHRWMDLLQSPA
jgi:hypothetical protein